jgi:Zn-dependent peptidase ImmA (M78 family)
LIQQVGLVHQVRELAKRTRKEILDENLELSDFDRIARKYGVRLTWQELPIDRDGHYSKDLRTITLNSMITNPERQNFNFCHELIHDRVDRDDYLYEQIHEYAAQLASETFMDDVIERLCNAGAAELLIPSEDVRRLMLEKGFSTTLIPPLCECFGASSIAVAFQIVTCASHDCYLVIAEPRLVNLKATDMQLPMPNIKPISIPQEQLVIIYTGGSPAAKYSIKRHQTIPANHLLYNALKTDEPLQGTAKIPFASGNGWDVSCEALCFRGKVFVLFNITLPISSQQMRLF